MSASLVQDTLLDLRAVEKRVRAVAFPALKAPQRSLLQCEMVCRRHGIDLLQTYHRALAVPARATGRRQSRQGDVW